MRKSSRNTTPARSRGDWDFALIAILAAAFALRLTFVLQFRGSPFFANLFSDSLLYDRISDQILHGGGPVQAWFMSPLYPFLLALVKSITQDFALWTRLLQCFAGTATVWFVFLATRDLVSRRAALTTAAIAALYPVLIFYDGQILFESLQVCLVAALIWSFGRALRNQRTLDFIASGVILGLLTINRATTLLIAPFLLMLFYRQKKHVLSFTKALIFVLAPIVVLIVPFAWHNLAAEGVFIPITSSGGYNFYAGNNAEAKGMYKIPEDVDLYSDLNGKMFAERQTGRTLNSGDVSAYWSAKAWRWIEANPGDFALLLARKAMMFFHPREFDQMGLDPGFVTMEYGTVLALLVIGFPLVFILALCGTIAAIRAKKSMAVPAAIFLGIFLGSLAFFVNGRIRMAALPPMLVVGGFAVEYAIDTYKRKAWKNLLPIATGIVAGALLMMLEPRVHQSWDQEYLRLGQIAFSAGDIPGAEGLFRKSILQKTTVQGLTNLANSYAAQGKNTEAEQTYVEALRLNPSYPLLQYNLGNFAYARGNVQQAMTSWLRATALQNTMAPAWRNLGLACYHAGQLQKALEYLTKAREFETDGKTIAAIERDLASLRQQLDAGAGSETRSGAKK